MELRTVKLGDELFVIESYIRWCNKGQSWYANCGVRPTRTIAIGADGRVCFIGKDFMAAEYPVTVYEVEPAP